MTKRLLKELTIDAGQAKIYALTAKDAREMLRVSASGGDAVEAQEKLMLRSVTINDEPLTLEQIDELSFEDYLELMQAQSENFTRTRPKNT
ncbi:MAG: hypothetical protein II870_08985 [Synergistaceae bacterium]|nr:hypothetical protein [Synergistaceae bacterium]MBQ6909653.1 hypothetical protein [Synergistaceae bacterium]